MDSFPPSLNHAHLDEEKINQLAQELNKCIKKDQLVKAKFILKNLKLEEKKKIVHIKFSGNAPLFVAARNGQVHFVNYLLEECGADIEQRGIYEVREDLSTHEVTPLWCSAVANKLQVVKTLITRGADVNATSDTQSTPVRSACFMTNIEVVKYLVENGGNIHKPNVNGGSCLINSVQSVELCRFLIEHKADPNFPDNSGNLAIHYAIREGRLPTVQLLLNSGTNLFKENDFGDDAFQTAALRGYEAILDYLISKSPLSIARQVECYELLGTNFVDEKHDIPKAIKMWERAMELRTRNKDSDNVECLASLKEAYNNHKECQTLEELNSIVANQDAIYMQSLSIRERILGTNHKDTIFGLMYRGAVYADTHSYQRCVDLWKYAFQLRHEKNEPLNHECLFTLQALCKLFWEISDDHKQGFTAESVRYADAEEVLDMTFRELQAANEVIKGKPVNQSDQENFNMLMLLTLHLINIMIKIQPNQYHLNLDFKRKVHSIILLKPAGADGKTLLHLALNRKSSFVSGELYSNLPSLDLLKLLLQCGADPNARDVERNTVLHDALLSLKVRRETLGEGLMTRARECFSYLIHDATHLDVRNVDGQTPLSLMEELPWLGQNITILNHVTLKCLSARTIQQYGIKYRGEVPISLEPFIEMH